MRLIIFLSFLIPTSVHAYATVLLGSDIATDELVRIDKTNASTQSIAVLPQALRGLAFDYGSNTLYGLGFAKFNIFTIFVIDPIDGSSSILGTLTGVSNATALAFDPLDKLLYVSDSDSLAIFDPATGITSNGPKFSGFSHVEGLSFNPNTGTLYGIADDGPGRVIEIDKESGVGVTLPVSGISNNPRALAFDPSLNSLFIGTSDFGSGNLFRLDLTNSTLNLTGSLGPTQALVVIVPELTSFSLLGIGLCLVGMKLRWR